VQAGAVSVNEFARFAADLARAAVGLDESAESAVERVSKAAHATAYQIAPVDTGDLRSGLRVRRVKNRAVVEVTSYYATFQEFGTTRMAPNPFIGPAFDRHAPDLVREVEKIRDATLDKLS